jgi:hypothetical protein
MFLPVHRHRRGGVEMLIRKCDVTEFDIHARDLEDVVGKFGELLHQRE